jgi:hypothetical protein
MDERTTTVPKRTSPRIERRMSKPRRRAIVELLGGSGKERWKVGMKIRASVKF